MISCAVALEGLTAVHALLTVIEVMRRQSRSRGYGSSFWRAPLESPGDARERRPCSPSSAQVRLALGVTVADPPGLASQTQGNGIRNRTSGIGNPHCPWVKVHPPFETTIAQGIQPAAIQASWT